VRVPKCIYQQFHFIQLTLCYSAECRHWKRKTMHQSKVMNAFVMKRKRKWRKILSSCHCDLDSRVLCWILSVAHLLTGPELSDWAADLKITTSTQCHNLPGDPRSLSFVTKPDCHNAMYENICTALKNYF